MRISAKGRYGLAALIEIASHSHQEQPLPLVSVAESLGVSKLFLEQVATLLKRAGLITAVKGAKGGYLLSQEPSEITALDVLKAVETTLFETSQNETLEKAPAISDALSTRVFTPLDEAIESSLSQVTLKDLMDYVSEHGDDELFMFYI